MERISLLLWPPVGYCSIVWKDSALQQCCPREYKKKWIFLSAALIAATAIAASCGNDRDGAAHLRAADVPVHALVQSSADPTIAFPELFPLQIAVYWTNPNGNCLAHRDS